MHSRGRQFAVTRYIVMAALLILAPLCGAIYLDLPPGQYLEFPPRTKYIAHAPFSRPVFFTLSLAVAAACLPFMYRMIVFRADRESGDNAVYPFPGWGWLGMLIILVSWVLAWNRFSFFAGLQRYTFTPLWIGYILVVNGLSCRRTGTCLLRSRPLFYMLLFPASMLFWWYFEYLNRFVQNWYYIGGGDISAAEYVIHASICFSTVLPAVVATYEFLRSIPRVAGAFVNWHPVTLAGKKTIGLLLISAAAFSLAGLAVFPDYLFPLVWISPLLVIAGMQLVTGRATVFSGVERGDWRGVVLPALAALMCGFFWEMWNWKSLAHWEYSVPFVHRFQIFAMPLPGYAGYLPFGLECMAAASLINAHLMKTDQEELFMMTGRGESVDQYGDKGADA